MEDEPEVIRQRMEEKRTALSEKLEALENQLTGTVGGAAEAVNETVENVKESVQESVHAVTDAVHETVRTLKETFDFGRQFERHPWLMFGGSLAVGFLAERLLRSPSVAGPEDTVRSIDSGLHLESWGQPTGRKPEAVQPASEPKEQGPSLLREALGSLRGVAVGVAMGLLRDLAAEHLPDNLKDTVTETVNGLTTKLGGKLLPSFDLHSDNEPSSEPVSPGTTYRGPQTDTLQHEEVQSSAKPRRSAQAGRI